MLYPMTLTTKNNHLRQFSQKRNLGNLSNAPTKREGFPFWLYMMED